MNNKRIYVVYGSEDYRKFMERLLEGTTDVAIVEKSQFEKMLGDEPTQMLGCSDVIVKLIPTGDDSK